MKAIYTKFNIDYQKIFIRVEDDDEHTKGRLEEARWEMLKGPLKVFGIKITFSDDFINNIYEGVIYTKGIYHDTTLYLNLYTETGKFSKREHEFAVKLGNKDDINLFDDADYIMENFVERANRTVEQQKSDFMELMLRKI